MLQGHSKPACLGWAVQVHALVRFGPAEGTLARLKWFASISYIVGGHQYSSNDIEHGVLRGNKPSPANVLSLVGLSSLAPLTFKDRGPSHAAGELVHHHKAAGASNAQVITFVLVTVQVIKPPDPRIHFALVCGAKSCPPIKVCTNICELTACSWVPCRLGGMTWGGSVQVYTADTLQEGLESAAQGFVEGTLLNQLPCGTTWGRKVLLPGKVALPKVVMPLQVRLRSCQRSGVS